jgi:hypothetical protein
MSDKQELAAAAVEELKAHGGFPALTAFIEATTNPPAQDATDTDIPEQSAA